MSLGFAKIKIGLRQEDGMKYVSQVEGTDYQLSDEAQVFSNEEGTRVVNALRKQEPDKDFIVLDGEAED